MSTRKQARQGTQCIYQWTKSEKEGNREKGTCVVVINDLPGGYFSLLLGIWHAVKYERDIANCRGIGTRRLEGKEKGLEGIPPCADGEWRRGSLLRGFSRKIAHELQSERIPRKFRKGKKGFPNSESAGGIGSGELVSETFGGTPNPIYRARSPTRGNWADSIRTGPFGGWERLQTMEKNMLKK